MGDLMLKEFATKISIAISGGKSPVWFERDVGLCSNLTCYMDSKGINYQRERRALREQFNDLIELHREFSSTQYPFNVSAVDYLRDIEDDVVYENSCRLAFIEVLKNDNQCYGI